MLRAREKLAWDEVSSFKFFQSLRLVKAAEPSVRFQVSSFKFKVQSFRFQVLCKQSGKAERSQMSRVELVPSLPWREKVHEYEVKRSYEIKLFL